MADRNTGDEIHEPDETPSEPTLVRRRRWWRSAVLAVFALLAVAGVVGTVLLVSGAGIRRNLLEARQAMQRGADLLVDGDAEAALSSFETGRRLFASAADRAEDPLFRATAVVPIVGRTPDAVAAIAEAGVSTADAAILLAEAAAEIPGGVAGLAPSGGGVPLDRFPALGDAARRAEQLLADALERVEDAPRDLLIGPVAPARRSAETELRDLHDAVRASALVLEGLPAFLGADGPRRYFFGAQNPAELRGTGGVIGAYAILTIDGGRFEFTTFRPIQSLGVPPPDAVEPPNADYEANYEGFRGGQRFWTAINVMPDLPSVAETILRSYAAATGEQLDGVILADPFALQAVLRASGPVEVPGRDIGVDASNVIPFVTNEAYSIFNRPAVRKRILGDVAGIAFERFLSKPNAQLRDLRLLLRAARDGHLLIYSTDPGMQEGLRGSAVGGALTRPDGNLTSVVVTSSAGSKVDYYQQREIEQTVALGEDGDASVDLALRLRNTAPTEGQPRYVIGPYRPREADGRVGPIVESLEAGESVALVNVYCGESCVPQAIRLDGAGVEPRAKTDLGLRYVQQYYSVPSGDESLLEVEWLEPEAWEGNSSGGVYRLTVGSQVTINPTQLRLVIEPPEEMRVRDASAPLRIEDGRAVYEGELTSSLDLEVEFAPSVPVRLWRNVLRFLTRPVF